MTKLETSVFIKAPVEKVWDYFSNPMNAPEWENFVLEVKDVKGEGVGRTFKIIGKLLGIRVEMECTWLEVVPQKKLVERTKGGAELTATWNLAPENDGSRLSISGEYTISVPFLRKFADKLIVKQVQREVESSLQTLKAILEG